MPSRSRLRRKACAATIKLEHCAQENCKYSHTLFDFALLEHITHRPSDEDFESDTRIIAVEYMRHASALAPSPWTARYSIDLSDGPSVLAIQNGVTLTDALRSLLVDSDAVSMLQFVPSTTLMIVSWLTATVMEISIARRLPPIP